MLRLLRYSNHRAQQLRQQVCTAPRYKYHPCLVRGHSFGIFLLCYVSRTNQIQILYSSATSPEFFFIHWRKTIYHRNVQKFTRQLSLLIFTILRLNNNCEINFQQTVCTYRLLWASLTCNYNIHSTLLLIPDIVPVWSQVRNSLPLFPVGCCWGQDSI